MSAPMTTASWQGLRPPFLAALMLWGWQHDLLAAAIAMGVLLELPRVVRLRFDIAQADFDRLWSFTSVLFLAVVFYLLLARQGLGTAATFFGTTGGEAEQDSMHRVSGTALTFLRWLPFVLYPFTLAHAWSRSVTLPWSTFSLYEQARAKRAPHIAPPEWAVKRMQPGYLYLGVTLFTSTTANAHLEWYLPLMMGVLVWSLWPWRNRRYGVVAWGLLLVVLAGIAVAARFGHLAARAAWQAMEGRMTEMAGSTPNLDQQQRTLAFGAVGALQLSGTIVLWVDGTPGKDPGLLRDAAFNRYRNGSWSTSHQTFQPLERPKAAGADAAGGATTTFTVTRYTLNGEALVAAPVDVLTAHTAPPAGIEVNDIGALRLHEGPELASYTVTHGAGGGSLTGPPEPDDTTLALLNPDEREALSASAAEAGLPGSTPAEAVAKVERWFGKDFTYSLWQERRRPEQSALAHFLRTTKAGHCEYYATATALLLRTAGVPTRYAVGYSPSESSGDTWLARGRDAHAWCLAWVDGAWRDVDTTPGTWHGAEAARTPWYEGLHDRLSQAWYRFTLWKQGGGNWRIMVFVVGMLVLAWIAWRQIRGSKWRRIRDPAAGTTADGPPGGDSEFFAVLRRLAEIHGERQPHETPQAWLRRLPVPADQADLRDALALHQRLRFDPGGLPRPERDRLRLLAQRLAVQVKPLAEAAVRKG